MNQDSEKLWNLSASHWSQNIHKGLDLTRDKFTLPAFLQFLGNIEEKEIFF